MFFLTELLPRASLKAIASLLPLSTYAQIFVLDFRSNIFSRIFFQIFFCGFFQLFFPGFSCNYSFADFLSNIISRIFVRIFFCGFSFKNGYAGSYKKSVGGALFDGTVTYGFTKSIESFNLFIL